MSTVAVIQARMGSTRLPGKIMRPIRGATVLGHVLTRVRACPQLDAVVVATTTNPADDQVAAESRAHGARVFRGSELDVLDRYYHAAKENQAAAVVRITSDCPLFDPHLLTRMIDEFHSLGATGRKVDYLSNTLQRTFPRGLDVEIFTFAALERAHREAAQPHEREHVTPYIHQHPELFCLRNFAGPEDLSHHRWTLDTEDDLRFVEAVYAALHREGELFSTEDVLRLLAERPDLALLNAHVEQKKLGQ